MRSELVLLLCKYTVSTLQRLLPKRHLTVEGSAAAGPLLHDPKHPKWALVIRFLFADMCYFPAIVRPSSEGTKL